MNRNHHKPIAFIRELCKDKSEEEVRDAEGVFRRYLDLVRRITERLEREEQERLTIDSTADGDA